MNKPITPHEPIAPHEPNELIVASVEEAFADAKASTKRWQEWEHQHQLKAVSILLPEAEYAALENLATQQQRTAPQLIQALVHSVLTTLKV